MGKIRVLIVHEDVIARRLAAGVLVKYFAREGLEWRLREEVRRPVEFRQLNLAEPWTGVPPQDVVLLRNVLIYFDVADKRQALARVRRVRRPDGALFLGGAETTLNLDEELERVPFARTCWYRVRPRGPLAGGGAA